MVGDAIDDVAGTIDADLAIDGPLRTPHPHGALSISNGSGTILIGDAAVGLSNIAAVAAFDGETLVIDRIRGLVAEGELTGTGRGTLGADPSLEISLAIRGSEVEPFEKLNLTIDSDLVFSKRGSAPLALGGEMKLREGNYENFIQLEEVLLQMTRLISGADRPERFREQTDMGLQLHFVADNSLLVNTNFLQGEIRSDVSISGNASKPQLDGFAEVTSGTFGPPSQPFDVVRAKLLFSPENLDPRLDILGESSVSDQRVRIAVTGTLVKPIVNFGSDGGLSEREVRELVAGGASASRFAVVSSERNSPKNLKQLFNPLSDSTLAERVSGITGVTSVDIGTSFSAATGEYVPKLFMRRPIVEDLDLVAESELSGTQRNQIGVEYPLTNRFTLKGGWQDSPATTDQSSTSGAFTAGVRYRKTFPAFDVLIENPLRNEGKEGERAPDGAR